MGSKHDMGAEGKSDLFLYDPEKLTIVTDPKHPLYDPRVKLQIDESTVKSIMFYGVLEPVIVSKLGDEVRVVDGRQRVANAREANRRLVERGMPPVRVPCVTKRGTEAFLAGVASATFIRQEEGPLDQAKRMQHLLDLGRSEEEVQTDMGISASTVANYKAMLETSPAVQEEQANGSISSAVAVTLSTLSEAKQWEVVQKIKAKKARGAKAEKIAKEATGKKDREPKVGPSRREVVRLRKALSEAEAELNERAVNVTLAVQVLDYVLGNGEKVFEFYPELRK